MRHFLEKRLLILYVIFPLVLSIGVTPAFSLQPTDVDTECRSGQTLVYRIIHGNFVCTSSTTANSWVNFGLAELVKDFESEEISRELSYVDGVRIKIS